MQKYRRAVTGGIAVLGLAAAALTAVTSVPAAGANQPRGHRLVALAKSRPQTSDTKTGSYTSGKMSVEVALAPGHQAALSKRLGAVYDPNASQYHHWLRKGQFDAMYAPSAAARSAVSSYLTAHGLVLGKASTPFLVRASGSSAQVTAAFHTQLNTYTGTHGQKYFSNSTAVKLPGVLAAKVTGVIGLSNTVRAHMSVKRTPYVRHVTGKASCEAPYPTRQQLFKAINQGVGFPFGYGAAPGCNGLTPSQLNSLYGAPHAGDRAKGAGQNVAVFELSGYQHSDVATFTHQFYGAGYHPPLVDINVDGGPIHPVCPAGDTCPPEYNGYAGDVEVVADIETELAAAPAVKHLLVYNAPNDYTGQTELDEYARIAGDDSASSISSSWGLCENDAGAGYAQAENVLFEQIAMQGQSMFGAAGDTGAFGCIRSDGTTILNLVDPPSQPWVTSVGGTSRTCATTAPRRVSRRASSGAGPQVPEVAVRASSGVGRPTSTGLGSRVRTPRTETARPSARSRQQAHHAGRPPTCPPSPMSSRRTPSTAPAPTRRRTAPVRHTPTTLQGGSGSAAPACRRRSGQRSPLTGQATPVTASATSTQGSTGRTPTMPGSSSTT
jgi:subtilase family serine protease